MSMFGHRPCQSVETPPIPPSGSGLSPLVPGCHLLSYLEDPPMTFDAKVMDLRDWFAVMALQALLAQPETWPAPGSPRAPSKARARAAAGKAYQLADAMLEERAKKPMARAGNSQPN